MQTWGLGQHRKRERKQGSDAMRTAQGVVTPPPEGRWGEMAAFGFPHRLRNRGLSSSPRLMRKRTSLCPSFDALWRGTKVLVFLGWVGYQMLDVRAVRVSTQYSPLSLPFPPAGAYANRGRKGNPMAVADFIFNAYSSRPCPALHLFLSPPHCA